LNRARISGIVCPEFADHLFVASTAIICSLTLEL
jgi:hypothetical protein